MVYNKLKENYPVTSLSLLSYTLFCGLSYVSLVLPKEVFGEFVDVLKMSAFLWPYPLLLSLQKFIDPNSWISFAVADIIGLGQVAFGGFLADRLLKKSGCTNWKVVVPLGIFGWMVLLGCVQLAMASLAFLLGWPLGE